MKLNLYQVYFSKCFIIYLRNYHTCLILTFCGLLVAMIWNSIYLQQEYTLSLPSNIVSMNCIFRREENICLHVVMLPLYVFIIASIEILIVLQRTRRFYSRWNFIALKIQYTTVVEREERERTTWPLRAYPRCRQSSGVESSPF
jgi:hypothetical protein